ncbi:MAG: TetR/AcrR family transcriptional regulator [Pseudomonadota bacterium]
MPRMSEAEKRKSHNKILDAAAQMVRAKGVEGTSVSDVMQAAGLTHGGFYRHFGSKDDLVAAAFRTAVDDVLSEMEKATSLDAKANARHDYIDSYLSQSHIDNRSEGCPLAALAGDLSRDEGKARQEGFAAVERVATLLKEEPDVSQGTALLALMLGTVTLARLAQTKEEAGSVLQAGRKGVDLLQKNWSP